MLYMPSETVVILGAARTPQALLGGPLEQFKATQLGAFAIRGALDRAGIAPIDVDCCIMGNVVSAGLGHAPAKQAAVGAGIPHNRPSKAVNTVCASGMTAVQDACLALTAGLSKIVVAGGMESRSTAPYYLGPFAKGRRRIPGKTRGNEFRLKTPRRDAPVADYIAFLELLASAGIREASISDSLACPFSPGLLMKDYAVRYAGEAGLSIEEINAAAAWSYRKARAAAGGGDFAEEIVPAGDICRDEIISEEREADLRAISYGYVTAYNAPQLADGAAALVLSLEETALEMGLRPLARITGISRVDTEPAGFIGAPIDALREVEKTTLAADTGAPTGAPTIIEANESFGLQDPLFRRAFPDVEINPYGGSVALGHPVGASGARVVVTLLNAMARRGHKRGSAAICFGSGGAMAAAIEVV